MEAIRLESRAKREQKHFDEMWGDVCLPRVEEVLSIPGVTSLRGKRILICSCGSQKPAGSSAACS